MSFDLSLKDCDKAIELDPKFIKAFLRKANAQKGQSVILTTVWGGRLCKMFCNMFAESSPCLLGQPSCLWNSQKTYYKTFGISGRPNLKST